MALTLTNISSIILKGEHLLADKVYEEFTNAEYSSDSDKKGQRNHFTNDLYHLVSALQYRENHNIINDDTVNLYLELERRLGSYVDPYSIDPNYSPPAGVIILPGDQYRTFLSLLDTPDSYNAVANFLVGVDSAQDGLIFIDPATIGGVTSLTNGLHETGSIGKLGGLLTEDTTIDVSNFPITLSSADFRTFMRLSPGVTPQWSLQTKDTLTIGSFTSNPSVTGGVTMSMFGNAGSTTQSLNITLSSMKILDTKNHKGLVYNADYSAVGRLDDRWIPDWGSIHTMFENGLQIVADGNIGIGGSLTDYTQIDIGHFGFQLFSAFSGNDQMSFGMNSAPEGSSIITSVVSLVSGLSWSGQQFIEPSYYGIQVSKQSSGTTKIEINPPLLGGVTSGICFTDDIYSKGARYLNDYHVNNATNPRWIPDKGYVDSAIADATPVNIFFGTGSLLGAGTSPSPYYPNAGNGLTNSDVTNGIILGGSLNRNTTVTTTGFNLNLASTSTTIVNFLNGATPIASVNSDAQYYGQGLVNYLSGFNSRVAVGLKGTMISRGVADGNTTATIVNTNYQANGLLLNVENYYRNVLTVDFQGTILHSPISQSSLGSAKAHYIGGILKSLANGDNLIGLEVDNTYGSSITTSYGSLVGGTGYPNGTQQLATFTGGTGTNLVARCVVSGGIIQSYVITDTGVNYTNGDVVTFVILDSSGIPTGSGGTLTITGVTSYTGVVDISAKFKNAPIVLDTISTPTTFVNGMIWQDGTHIYARIGGVTKQLD